MITRIEATNYRCFERLDLDLGEFGVVVGANGAGKTTLLDIPVLLGDLLKTRHISLAFLENNQLWGPRASTLTELVFQGRGDWFILAVEARLPDRVVRDLLEGATEAIRKDEERWPRFIRYELRLQVFNKRALQVQNEYLFTFAEAKSPPRSDQEGGARLHGEIHPRREWHFICRREYGGEVEFRPEARPKAKPQTAKFEADTLAFSRVQFEAPAEYPAACWLFELLADGVVFFEPEWRDLRKPSPPGLPQGLTGDGQNFPWLALRLKKEAPERFESWLTHVQTALPQVTAIELIEREEDYHAYFRVRYNDSYEVTSSGLSKGTLRILALTLLPYLPAPPRFLIVEEPETGIHPRAIEAVLQSLSSVYDSQVLLSSHSPIVLAHTMLDHVLATRLQESGAVTAVPGRAHPRLAEWKGQLDLGSLFAAGVLS